MNSHGVSCMHGPMDRPFKVGNSIQNENYTALPICFHGSVENEACFVFFFNVKVTSYVFYHWFLYGLLGKSFHACCGKIENG